METYVRTGKVQYQFRNYPLTSIHPQASKAAEAAECAGEQGLYWDMHEALFESQAEWSGQQNAVQVFKNLAGELGLDQGRFDGCLDNGTYADLVAADQQDGIADGVRSTPSFLINGSMVTGAQQLAAFQQLIEYYLAGGEEPSLEVAADSYRSLGEPDAPVVVTEFSDYQCPSCGSVARGVIPDLIEQYVETGKVRFVYREFPLDSIHPAAQKASEAAVCAGQQDYFWEMNEQLFATQGEWGTAGVDPTSYFKTYAQDLGLDTQAFNQCLDSGEAAIVVLGDILAGESVAVSATPYFFVNDLPIRGGLPIESFKRVIDYVAAGGTTPSIIPVEGDWHLQGNRQTAQAITVAFVDYASPESAQHALEVWPQLLSAYVDSGQMVYILHPWADMTGSPSAQAANAAECAGDQGSYWEMHDRLFQEQSTWTKAAEPRPLFTDYAKALSLDTEEFETCLDSDWANLRVQAGTVVGTMYGVPDAPVFLFNNGQGQRGSPTFEEFKAVIDSILGQ